MDLECGGPQGSVLRRFTGCQQANAERSPRAGLSPGSVTLSGAGGDRPPSAYSRNGVQGPQVLPPAMREQLLPSLQGGLLLPGSTRKRGNGQKTPRLDPDLHMGVTQPRGRKGTDWPAALRGILSLGYKVVLVSRML